MVEGAGMEDPVDAIVWLKPPIMVDASLAGQTFTVRINDRVMSLTLPLESAELEEPPQPSTIPPFPSPKLADGFSRGAAATRVGSGTGDHELAAGAIRLQFSDAEMRRNLGSFRATEDFVNAVDSWLSIVRDWLYSWAACPGHDFRIPAKPEFRLALPDNPEHGTESGGGSYSLIVIGERPATPEEWQSAIRAASAHENLPLPYKLLSEAVLHRAGGESRNAVITACSAGEVALGEVARSGLEAAGWNPKQTKAILASANGLIDLYRVCAGLPDRPPVSIGEAMNKLASPRNLAAHEGADPDDAAVGGAIETASKIVRTTPLPRPQTDPSA
jgi:hypothetical protein